MFIVDTGDTERRSYLQFLHDLDEIHVVLHWIDDNQDVSKVSWDDTTPVVSGVL